MSLDRDAYSRVGKSLVQKHQQEQETQIEVFRQALINFATDYSAEIAANNEFSAKFTQMCVLAGLDPLQLMLVAKRDNFANGVAVKLVEICDKTIHINGGLMAMADVISQLGDSEVGLSVDEEAVEQAVKVLGELGPGYSLIGINGQKWLKYSSATDEMLVDQRKVYELCQFMGGFVTYRLLRDNHGWERNRCERVVDEMISRGLLWIDYGPPEGREMMFWVPSI